MPNPLKSLKTAKFAVFCAKNIKDLANPRISLAKRFRFVLAKNETIPFVFRFARNPQA